MKILQAFKFELKISGAIAQELSRIAGSCRFIYNKSLSLQKERYENGEKKLSYANLCKQLTVWKKQTEFSWLNHSPSQVMQQSLKDLEKAYQNFFAKRADFPRFKKRGINNSFRFPQGFKLDQANNRIFLPKLGWLKYRNSREVLGEICYVTISRHINKWKMSITTEREVVDVIHPSVTAVGVDVGITRLATLSDGKVYEPVNSYKQYQHKLARLQRKLSKKKKTSQNFKKMVLKVKRTHQKISNIRNNYLHQTSHAISKNHAMVCLEDLQIKNMSKSAAGSITKPGKNVKAKSVLNKAILDQGWHELRRQITYKQMWRGGTVIFVFPRNTSRTCPECGHIDADNRLTQANFLCVQCLYENNADLVGAINILRAGHARLACGEMMQLGHSMNQEPTEV